MDRKKRIGSGVQISIRTKMIIFIIGCVIPLTLVAIISIYNVIRYSQIYDGIVQNITATNDYNIGFKKTIDEEMYRIIIGSANWTDSEEKLEDTKPEEKVEKAILHFKDLYKKAEDAMVKKDLRATLKLLDILNKRIADIMDNVEEGGHYDENMEMLEMNINTLTGLIQEDIQMYIYHEAINMENIRREISIEITRMIQVMMGTLVIIFFGTLIAARFFAGRMTKPITNLCAITKKFAGGDFSVRYKPHSGDEMETLADSFNSMVEEITILVEDIKKEQKNLRRTELQLLQEQINPHFLYNTLDTIMWLTEAGEKQQAVDMIGELSTFFRTTLSKGHDRITVREEENHIHSYLEIQQYRYRDILAYEIDFPEEIKNFYIIKLALQPLVENALYHGIKNKRGKGRIKVKGKRDENDLIFTVEDTGIGMTETELQFLRDLIAEEKPKNNENEKDSGFGLANVQQRLRMYYGEEYGVSVDSIYGRGSIFQVKIPVVEQLEEEEREK